MDQNLPGENTEIVGEEAIEISYPKFLELRLYLIGSFLLAGSLALPFALHLFGVAGQIFMPIYLFALLAGLVYGWRCGILIGMLAPLISFSITQMPPAVLLPFVVVKAVSLGLVSGIIVEQLKGKRLYAAGICAVLFSLISGNLFLFIVTSNNRLAAADFIMGYPGVIFMLIAIPYIANKILRYERKIIHRYSRQIKGLQV